MIRDHFRVLIVNLSSGRGHIEELDGRNTEAGGSGLGALLYEKYGHAEQPWNHPDQPLILAIGPLTGYFPLMSKTVCAFKSPYHDQYAESHAGGRSALSLRFADLDALVVTGTARNPSCLSIGSKHLDLVDVPYIWGTDVQASGAGETGSAMACINVDTYRHFGRLGSGAVMGSKNLKAIVIQGDGVFPLKETTKYSKLFSEVHKKLTATDMMMKYHSLGTASNLESLNTMQSLPWRNLKQTTDPDIEGICIHMGFVREKFRKENRYVYRQVSYDYEPIFATGSMLGVTDAFAVLNIMDVVEKVGLDVMSAGVALAWATEALEKGIISEEETLVALRFGEAKAYEEAVRHLGTGANDFYRLLSQGTMKAAGHYGGSDFACVLGQEMGGYATGEVYFAAQSLGFRHSHLDTGGYSYDQKHDDKDVDKAVDFLVSDEQGRVFLTSMVACLFARAVYTDELLADCLRAVGYHPLADNMKAVSENIQKLRWKTRFATGFDPQAVKIPKRFTEVTTWKGPIDQVFLETLKREYGKRLVELAKEESKRPPA